MIPNPVQRNARRADESCAPEGGSFHEPVPVTPIPEYSLPTWAMALIVLATCAACAWIGA